MPKGKKGKRRKLAEPGSRSAVASKHLDEGTLVFTTRVAIIARQLDTAIELWFNRRDAVSIHVLAACAHRNLHEIGEPLGKGPRLNQTIGNDRLYLSFDAFRHGSSDVDFVPAATEGLILDALISFHAIYGHRTAYMSTFGAYAGLYSTLQNESDNAPFYEGLSMRDVRHLSREDFFAKLVSLFGRREPTIRGGVPRKIRLGLQLP